MSDFNTTADISYCYFFAIGSQISTKVHTYIYLYIEQVTIGLVHINSITSASYCRYRHNIALYTKLSKMYPKRGRRVVILTNFRK